MTVPMFDSSYVLKTLTPCVLDTLSVSRTTIIKGSPFGSTGIHSFRVLVVVLSASVRLLST